MLGESGPFASLDPTFSPREQQQAMAAAVEDCVHTDGVLVCEAGTGTGKTLAYLCAVLLAGRKTIISTGTKNLQEQLFGRELPLARTALGVQARCALLKGRANYLCQHRLERALADPPRDPAERDALSHVRVWAGRTHSGDRAECVEVSETSALWPKVTSTLENCIGTECVHYDTCHVLLARREAAEADIVVVNHHLFFADLALREEGFGEVLPGAEVVVFDEAHQLPEVATRFFGVSLSAQQLRELMRDAATAYQREAHDQPEFVDALEDLGSAVNRFTAVLGAPDRRLAWEQLVEQAPVTDALTGLTEALCAFNAHLEVLAERGLELESCERRGQVFAARLRFLSERDDTDNVRWVEIRPGGFTWHASPLEIAGVFGDHIGQSERAWVFTSATLSIGGSVAHFAERLGLPEHTAAIWESPFDYKHQSLCLVPQGQPSPGQKAYTDAVVDVALPLLAASGGRTFMLFTSHAALEYAARRLQQAGGYRLLMQGTLPRDELLQQFKHSTDAVLLGTSSFWEGVDVRGEALVCVIIDKLPFAPPDDPLLEARLQSLAEQGKEPFMSYQLPQAIIALKQGAGRLIRDEADCGVLVICDPRLYTRGYGSHFLKSLPPMPVTRDVQAAVEFLQQV